MGRPYIIPRRVIEGTLENLLRLKFFLSQCEKYFDSTDTIAIFFFLL